VKHLVTGGSGFLGNLIARRLIERGEDVTILDIWEDANRPEEIKYIECDIRDRDGVAKAMAGVDIVHHNVALVPLTKAGDEFWDVNVNGSRIAAEEAAKAGVENFIHMSSSALFGVPKRLPITNDTTPQPIEIYGKGKLAGEVAVRDTLDKAGVPLVIIRPRTILGEARLGIFQILFSWISENRNVYTIGKGEGGFQFVHAHDLMDAYMLALDAQKPGAYNVGTDRFGSLREALEHLIDHAGSTSQVKALPEKLSISTLRTLDKLHLSPLAPWHYMTYSHPFYFDTEPLHELGWKAKYSNDEMLAETYDWFMSHPQETAGQDNASAHRKAVPQKALGLLKRFS
jgi:nucleoside-diphosphate-sugar epimerase